MEGTDTIAISPSPIRPDGPRESVEAMRAAAEHQLNDNESKIRALSDEIADLQAGINMVLAESDAEMDARATLGSPATFSMRSDTITEASPSQRHGGWMDRMMVAPTAAERRELFPEAAASPPQFIEVEDMNPEPKRRSQSRSKRHGGGGREELSQSAIESSTEGMLQTLRRKGSLSEAEHPLQEYNRMHGPAPPTNERSVAHRAVSANLGNSGVSFAQTNPTADPNDFVPLLRADGTPRTIHGPHVVPPSTAGLRTATAAHSGSFSTAMPSANPVVRFSDIDDRLRYIGETIRATEMRLQGHSRPFHNTILRSEEGSTRGAANDENSAPHDAGPHKSATAAQDGTGASSATRPDPYSWDGARQDPMMEARMGFLAFRKPQS